MRRALIALVLAVAALAVAAQSEAGYRESFKKEFIYQPWAGGEQKEISACLDCHASEKMKPEYQGIPQEWRQSWHYQNGVACHDCHGGDPKDSTLAMSHQRGFVGRPDNTTVPKMCGRCHVGILDLYMESGHGLVLKATGEGPSCVTCHGSHGIQKASIDIINEQRCAECHSYERAKLMKQALFLVDDKIVKLDKDFDELRAQGVSVERDIKRFFNTQAEFRTLFHAIDVEVVEERTSEFTARIDAINDNVQAMFSELGFRRKFSAFLFLVFGALSAVVFVVRDED